MEDLAAELIAFHFMKTAQSLLIILALLAVLLIQNLRAAVSFDVIPSAISNTYFGPIILQVTGLTNKETVVVQKFLDANTNGIVDGGDLLWQQFEMTDGSASVFTDGATIVTNLNVPGDLDGVTNGSIIAKLNQSAEFSQRIVGKYLLKLSSPSAGPSPITKSFNVTNFPFAQKFSGSVVSNATSTTLPNALVLVGTPDANGNLNLFAGTVADNSGNYSLRLAAGTYMLVAGKSNFVGSFKTVTNQVLSCGATINTNLSLTVCTRTISGKVMDLNTSVGIPGFLQPAGSSSGLLGLSVTDTNGNYAVRVTAGQWGLSHSPQALMLHGYLWRQPSLNVDTTAGNVTTNIALPKATALFYGSVKDSFGNPMPGVWLYAEDNINAYAGEGVTDVNGNYCAGVLGGASTWTVGIDNGLFFPDYVFSQGNQSTINTGRAISYSFFATNSGVPTLGNNGFEDGDFSDWQLSGDQSGAFVDDGFSSGITPHSGSYVAALNTTTSFGYLSQTLITVPCQSYSLSFWLNNPDGLTPNEFLVKWNGTNIFDHVNMPITAWTNVQFTVTATKTTTVLQFGFRDDSGYLGLDDVNLQSVSANAPQLTITRSGVNVLLTWPTNAPGFTVESATNLNSPVTWTSNSTSPVVVNGQNTITNPITGAKQFFRLISH
jgi:hypothetical protein